MKLSVHGAAQTVTGSKHLLALENGKQILLDCGMYQGMGKDTHSLNSHFGFDPSKVDYVLLSHAHIDHSGLIPRLVKNGFRGKIYCTAPTLDLCKIMLLDSAYIQQADTRFVNKRRTNQRKPLIKPLYTVEDAEKSLKFFVSVPFDREKKLDASSSFNFTHNGHILGSATINLTIIESEKTKRLTFTGDLGRYDTPLFRDPQSFPQADYILCESTYGNRLHDHLDQASQDLLEIIIHTCSEKKGKLVIPAFSLGRTQEIVYMLNKLDLYGLLPGIKVYVDSPLAVNATKITKKHVLQLNHKIQKFTKERPDPFGFDNLIYINNKEESQEINSTSTPCVIISASGMAEAGRVKHHIIHNIGNAANTILLVGYAEPLSLAGRLGNRAKQVTIFGEKHTVNAEIKSIDAFSAHGDYKEMIQYLLCQNPSLVQKMFLVHGEKEAQEHFKSELKAVGFNNIYIPSLHDSYYL